MVDSANPPAPPAEAIVDPVPEPEPEAASQPAQVYTLPTAGRVVSSGLQLALASTGDLRRASIYIGLLVLGSFGPAAIAVLLILGRLGDQAVDAFGSVFIGPSFGAPPQPALEAALLVVAIEALVGVAMFLTISIDAQIMAIAILGGRASDRPLRLWETIIRARQTFWRMAGAGAVVGVVNLLVQSLLGQALGGFSRSIDAASITAGFIATIAVAPLAYVATSIVLGDVGAMESLSRSWRLFKARRLLAVAVVLFTFVTSAIQLFALSSGLDLVVRASELLHVSLTEGAVAFAIAIVLILAAVVAYGSLTFTIGAIVSAPQVTGFLGLTFFSGGLDRARVDSPRPPRGFRYISRPMTIAMIALAGIVGLEIPAINSIPPPAASAILDLLREQAAAESDLIEVYGYSAIVEDRRGDVGSADVQADLIGGEAAYLGLVPPWLLKRFDCAADAVACGGSTSDRAFRDGAYLFLARGAAAPANAGLRIAVLVRLLDESIAEARDDVPYGGASRAYVAVDTAAGHRLELRREHLDAFDVAPTDARSLWSGPDLYVLVPSAEIQEQLLAWDIVTTLGGVASAEGVDTLRATWVSELRQWDFYGAIFIDDFRDVD